MEKVIFTNNTLYYFDQLVYTLFENDYFSYRENAHDYVDKIVSFVIESIDSFPQKTAPEKLVHLGDFYIFYKANHRTTWYIFFEKQEQKYLITSIINNHCEEARFIIT